MARNVNVSWVLPTTRESGRPLDPAEIAGVELSLSVDNTNFNLYDSFPANVTTTVIPELDIGEWFVRGIVKDTAGRASRPVTASIVVPDESAPGNLTSLILTF